jgi:replicative DNA helicase
MSLTIQVIEKAFLCTLFATPETLYDVAEYIEPDKFNDPRNQLIYETVLNLYEMGKDTSLPSVVGALNRNGTLQEAGNLNYLREIVAPSDIYSMNADPIGLATLIKEEAKVRAIKTASENISQVTIDRDGTDADTMLGYAEQQIQEIVNSDTTSSTSASIVDLLPEVLQDIENAKELAANSVAGVPTGFPEFDEMTQGFKPGQMIIVAARPAVGKSTLAVDFARNAAFLAGKTVLIFSLEMSKKELVTRVISAEARVKSQQLKTGDLTPEDWMNIQEAKERLQNGNLIIDDYANTSISRVRSVATRQKNRPTGLDMIIIDYIGLMEIPSTKRNSDSRTTDISALSRNIKLLAKELEIPIIALSQLNRKSEERQDRRPMVSDLRESGSLEQDADMVLLLHRPETADENNRPGETDLILGKHRGGPVGTVPLTSMLEYSKFVPGRGAIPREAGTYGSGDSGSEYATTEDETPW